MTSLAELGGWCQEDYAFVSNCQTGVLVLRREGADGINAVHEILPVDRERGSTARP